MKNKKEIDRLITEDLDAFKKLKAGWDSYSGKAITSEAIDRAERLLDFFIAPTSEGGILITLGSNDDVSVSIHSDGTWDIENENFK